MPDHENLDSSVSRVSSDLHKLHSSIVDRTSEHADQLLDNIINRRETFLQRLIPDPRKRAVVVGEVELVKVKFEALRRALVMVNETQLQSLQEACNQYLVRMKAANRADTFEYLASKTIELQTRVDDIFQDYIFTLDKKLTEAESINNPKLKKGRIEYLEKDFESFVALQKQFADKFLSIVSEGV